MNQNDMKTKNSLLGMNRASRVGSWTLAVTLIFLAVLIVINLVVAALPGRFTQFDTTNNGRYTLSQTTEKFIKGVNRNVELIVVTHNATVDATLQNFLERYTALNGKIKYRVVDPVADPTFLDNYTERKVSLYLVSDKTTTDIAEAIGK